MWGTVTNELRELAVTVLAVMLSLGTASVLAYIRRAKEALDRRTNHELADRALERVAYLVEVAVLATESTAAAALRQAVAEGQVGREKLVALGRRVAAQVLDQLDTETRKVLSETGDVRRYVEQLIEATLERYKARGVVGRMRGLASPNSETTQPK